MVFSIKPTRKKIQWIKENSVENARKLEKDALDRWMTEGGFVPNYWNDQHGTWRSTQNPLHSTPKHQF